MLTFALILAIVLMLLAAFAVRSESRADTWFFLGGASLALGHLLLWQFGLGGALGPVSLLFSPAALYLAGFAFILRYFWGDTAAWVRSLYLIVGLAALSPLFIWFVFFPILALL